MFIRTILILGVLAFTSCAKEQEVAPAVPLPQPVQLSLFGDYHGVRISESSSWLGNTESVDTVDLAVQPDTVYPSRVIVDGWTYDLQTDSSFTYSAGSVQQHEGRFHRSGGTIHVEVERHYYGSGLTTHMHFTGTKN